MKTVLFFSAALASVALLGFDYAGGVDSLTARPDGDGITVEWRSQSEAGLKSYTIERADVKSANDYQEASTVYPTGNYNYYKYHDSRISGIQAAGQASNLMRPMADAYKYRLRMNLATGEISYSQTVNVTRPSSGVRRTWGMIKEMFH
jgi:hypothetical protein